MAPGRHRSLWPENRSWWDSRALWTLGDFIKQETVENEIQSQLHFPLPLICTDQEFVGKFVSSS